MFSYVVRYDIGFAPNPFHGWCSLATCHEDFRGRVAVGDWVVGTGSAQKGLDGRLVYAMRVEEIIAFDDYWHDERFASKRPVRRGSMRQRYGDNIYHRDDDGKWVQTDSRHSHDDGTPNIGHIAKDTKADAVLLSRDYIYYGRSAPEIPARFRSWPGPAWTGARFDLDRQTNYDVCMRYSGSDATSPTNSSRQCATGYGVTPPTGSHPRRSPTRSAAVAVAVASFVVSGLPAHLDVKPRLSIVRTSGIVCRAV